MISSGPFVPKWKVLGWSLLGWAYVVLPLLFYIAVCYGGGDGLKMKWSLKFSLSPGNKEGKKEGWGKDW